MQPLRWLLVSLLLFSLFACTLKNSGKSIDLGTGSGVQVPGAPAAPVAQSTTPKAVLQVGTVWEKADGPCSFTSGPSLDGDASAQDTSQCDAVTTFQQTCTVDANSAVGADTRCNVDVPEGQLFYSSLRFQLKISSTDCARIRFQPYYYRASDQPGFTPAWNSASAIDCSVPWVSLSADCFNGPAKYIAPQFPVYTGLYSVFGKRTGTWNNLTAVPNTKSPANSNRFSSNNLIDAKRGCDDPATGLPAGDGYVCDTMKDYSFSCLDAYELPRFSISIRINSADDTALAAQLGLKPDQKESWAEYSN